MENKSYNFFLILVCLVFFLGCGQHVVHYSSQKCNVHPLIDGKIDSIWALIPHVKLHNYNLGEKYVTDSMDLSANYRMCWDMENLYILVTVIDDKVFDIRKFSYVTDIPANYDCDCVELFFDMNNDKGGYGTFDLLDDDFRFEFVFGGRYIGGSYKTSANINYQFAESEKGYLCEISIPFQTLGITPAVDTEFGFEISINDNDDSPSSPMYNFEKRSIISWSQVKGVNAWQNPSLFGNVFLIGN